MTPRNFISLLSMALLFLLNCNSDKAKTDSPEYVDTVHTSQNSLDWAGVYAGMLPCASCPGIEEEVHLNENGTYEIYTRYKEDKDSTVFREHGTFNWTDDGRNVVFTDSDDSNHITHFKVGENHLTQLDTEGKLITGNLADFYILNKVFPDNSIFEKYWRLTDLNGEQFPGPEGNNREAHLIFRDTGNRVNGSGGCNLINGTYNLDGDTGIQFSTVASTMMACPNLDSEHDFLQALETIKSYSIDDGVLSLTNGDGSVVARFKAVYLF